MGGEESRLKEINNQINRKKKNYRYTTRNNMAYKTYQRIYNTITGERTQERTQTATRWKRKKKVKKKNRRKKEKQPSRRKEKTYAVAHRTSIYNDKKYVTDNGMSL